MDTYCSDTVVSLAEVASPETQWKTGTTRKEVGECTAFFTSTTCVSRANDQFSGRTSLKEWRREDERKLWERRSTSKQGVHELASRTYCKVRDVRGAFYKRDAPISIAARGGNADGTGSSHSSQQTCQHDVENIG